MKKMTIVVLITLFYLSLLAAEDQSGISTISDTTQIAQITFLEFGSTTCIPCKQMEKVLEAVREKYGDQIIVTFYNVKKLKEIAAKYKIRMIPTQIFLDASGKEIHRHVGFYSEEKVDEFLQKQGLKINSNYLEKK